MPILEQLRLEEALLRTSGDNWCLMNSGAAPAIVMGISGKPEKLLALKHIAQDRVPVIKRFSGGGTVYIDPQTLFVTFISNVNQFPFPAQPKPIFEWTERLYRPFFSGLSLRENDYVLGDKKCAGNAQYIQKQRWLHHSSFLWDYDPEKMNYLLLPEKQPRYREGRSHADFLSKLKPLFPDKEKLLDQLKNYLSGHFAMTLSSLEEARAFLQCPHRTTSCLVDIQSIRL